MHHCEELIELIEMDILFAIFGTQNKKIQISQIKEKLHIMSCRINWAQFRICPIKAMHILMRYGGKFSTNEAN